MEIPLIDILIVVGGVLGSALIGFVGWTARKKWTQIEDHEVEITSNRGKFGFLEKEIKRVEANMVTKADVEDIFYKGNKNTLEVLSDVQRQLSENTTTMHTVLLKLAKQEGYKEAQKEAEERMRNGG